EGRVTLDGVDLRDISMQDLTRNIVMVTQEAYLFSGTVADNIALGKPGASREEIEAAARAIGADEFIEKLPYGYDTDVSKRGGRVSAGQRQLISFARAFLADPRVLILDEATSSLDIPSERMGQEGLTKRLGQRTSLIIAHRLTTVMIADRGLVVHGGEGVEDGAPPELVAAGGRVSALFQRGQGAAWGGPGGRRCGTDACRVRPFARRAGADPGGRAAHPAPRPRRGAARRARQQPGPGRRPGAQRRLPHRHPVPVRAGPGRGGHRGRGRRGRRGAAGAAPGHLLARPRRPSGCVGGVRGRVPGAGLSRAGGCRRGDARRRPAPGLDRASRPAPSWW